MTQKQPDHIEVRGARVHNLRNIDVDIPLHEIVGISGVSGSGKSSLALGVLYSEGSRRYLEALSTYTRRRMTMAGSADIESIRYVPAALALHQRPGVPGIRSTFGTSTELLNTLRLMFSRLSSHRCPNGHYVPPTMNVAAELPIVCPVCGEKFYGPGAEDLAFNSRGACKTCQGTGICRTVDESTLVPDDSLTIDEGAVAPWQTLMWSLMKDIARDNLGIRTNVPFRDLTEKEKDLVFHGEPKKYHMLYHDKTKNLAGEMDFTYFNAVYTVENALARVKDEKGMKRVAKFLKEDICPDCHGTRLSEEARAPRLMGISLGEATAMTLSDSIEWVKKVPSSLPEEMKPMAEAICDNYLHTAKRLMDLGLSYLTLDRAASTLSTGERQRTQLARAVRNRTTGVLYVLDEPSIGLHPSNIEGLIGVMDDLLADGNSIVLVDHDTKVLAHSDYLFELGPGAGKNGGNLLAQGTVEEIKKNPKSLIGPFLDTGKVHMVRKPCSREKLFEEGTISMDMGELHTVKPLSVSIPKGRMSVVTGVSGSGKTTLILESLIPAIQAEINGTKLPAHVHHISAKNISQVKLIDSVPIGINVRSTVATYANVHDELRKMYAKTDAAKAGKWKAGAFSYNTGNLRCETCDGTGSISLDVQFLPDVDIPCPGCHGSRYGKAAYEIRMKGEDGNFYSLPDLMNRSVDEVLPIFKKSSIVHKRLQVLHDLGLGYLTLGEETPGLSGGEAQRLKLASEMGKGQAGSIFVFDEPTIGLHPLDVETLLHVFQKLLDQGATVIVIEHDLDVIHNADYLIDMGPGGGIHGGKIVAAGTVEEIKKNSRSVTGRYL